MLTKLVNYFVARDWPVYCHLHDYMLRYWVLGARNATRNEHLSEHELAALNEPRGLTWITDRVAVRLHITYNSDPSPDMHDHPWWNLSIILQGAYWELVPCKPAKHGSLRDLKERNLLEPGQACHDDRTIINGVPYEFILRQPGNIVFRRAKARHRIVVPGGGRCVSLFIMGRKRREWGFYLPKGSWIHWRAYLGLQRRGELGQPLKEKELPRD